MNVNRALLSDLMSATSTLEVVSTVFIASAGKDSATFVTDSTPGWRALERCKDRILKRGS